MTDASAATSGKAPGDFIRRWEASGAAERASWCAIMSKQRAAQLVPTLCVGTSFSAIPFPKSRTICRAPTKNRYLEPGRGVMGLGDV